MKIIQKQSIFHQDFPLAILDLKDIHILVARNSLLYMIPPATMYQNIASLSWCPDSYCEDMMERSPCSKDSSQLDLNEKQAKHLTKRIFFYRCVIYNTDLWWWSIFLCQTHPKLITVNRIQCIVLLNILLSFNNLPRISIDSQQNSKYYLMKYTFI